MLKAHWRNFEILQAQLRNNSDSIYISSSSSNAVLCFTINGSRLILCHNPEVIMLTIGWIRSCQCSPGKILSPSSLRNAWLVPLFELPPEKKEKMYLRPKVKFVSNFLLYSSVARSGQNFFPPKQEVSLGSWTLAIGEQREKRLKKVQKQDARACAGAALAPILIYSGAFESLAAASFFNFPWLHLEQRSRRVDFLRAADRSWLSR